MYANNLRRLGGPLARTVSRSLTLQVKPQARFFNRRALQPWNEFNSASPIDEFMRDVGHQFQRMEQQMNSMFRDFGIGRPLLSTRSLRPAVESELVSEGNPSIYSLHIHLGENVDPEKVKLVLQNRVLTIEAKAEHQSEDGSSRLYQEITKKVTLPENIDPKNVKCHLTPDGSLMIEAMLPTVEEAKPKEIPIMSEGPGDQQVS
jgi:HSP20 family molecular chaperone IbpA